MIIATAMMVVAAIVVFTSFPILFHYSSLLTFCQSRYLMTFLSNVTVTPWSY